MEHQKLYIHLRHINAPSVRRSLAFPNRVSSLWSSSSPATASMARSGVGCCCGGCGGRAFKARVKHFPGGMLSMLPCCLWWEETSLGHAWKAAWALRCHAFQVCAWAPVSVIYPLTHSPLLLSWTLTSFHHGFTLLSNLPRPNCEMLLCCILLVMLWSFSYKILWCW
jgi:hypothetical protein